LLRRRQRTEHEGDRALPLAELRQGARSGDVAPELGDGGDGAARAPQRGGEIVVFAVTRLPRADLEPPPRRGLVERHPPGTGTGDERVAGGRRKAARAAVIDAAGGERAASDAAADAARRLENHIAPARLRDAPAGGDPGGAGADDRDVI